MFAQAGGCITYLEPNTHTQDEIETPNDEEAHSNDGDVDTCTGAVVIQGDDSSHPAFLLSAQILKI